MSSLVSLLVLELGSLVLEFLRSLEPFGAVESARLVESIVLVGFVRLDGFVVFEVAGQVRTVMGWHGFDGAGLDWDGCVGGW